MTPPITSTRQGINNIRKALGHSEQTDLRSVRPAVYEPRLPEPASAEIERFLEEVQKLSGSTQKVTAGSIGEALGALVAGQNIRKATLWRTPLLEKLHCEQILRGLGVDLVDPCADKHEMALCDLGITEAEYLLPETGTLVLKSSTQKPRAVSLLPHMHLAIVHPEMLRSDLHQVFAEAKNSNYLVFITGPSRTADIELTVTLGVHGPKNLFVWMLEQPVHAEP